MLFHKKIVSLPSPFYFDDQEGMGSTFKCHDYSTIIDVDVYKGGYDNYYCKVFYTTPGDSPVNENKQVTLLCVYEGVFIDSEKRYKENDPWDKPPKKLIIDDKYRFFKSVKLGDSNVPYNAFIYLHEELSVTENRDTKIGEIIT